MQPSLSWHQRLGLRWPLIQAPMAGAQGVELAIASSLAGGLGSVPAAMVSMVQLDQALKAAQAAGAQAINVNFFCHTMPPDDALQRQAWHDALTAHDRAWGVDRSQEGPPALREPFSLEALQVLERHRPAVVSFHFGLPQPDWVRRVKAFGAMVLGSATTVAEARWLEAHGADLIVAQGFEAGGHRGTFLDSPWEEQIGTMALLPQVVDAVRVPVVAAGGLADARAVRAAMALGAKGVMAGTAFLLAREATTSAVHRAALTGDAASHTVLTRLFSGKPARGIVNGLMRDLGPMNPIAPAFPHASTALAPLRRLAEAAGSGDFSPMWSGQGGCRYPGWTAGQVIEALAQGFDGFEAALTREEKSK